MPFDEKIVIVDDDPVIRDMIQKALSHNGYSCLEAEDGEALFHQMANQRLGLILLDINLPDQDGLTLLPQILEKDPEVCVVMLTGVVEVKTAMGAIRKGAFDYISKPFLLEELQLVVSRGLEKRRLEIENKQYHRTIEEKNLRLEILHGLSVRIAFSLLGTVELEEMLRTILVGITAGEGLGLNRAFLVLFDDSKSKLEGKIAIGPGSPEEAGRIWASLQERKSNLTQAIEEYGRVCGSENTRVNQIVREITFSYSDSDNILVRAVRERRSFNVKDGLIEDQPIQQDMINLLGINAFAIVPLCSSYEVQGVIIADNFITRKPIIEEDITAMELFANQASLAIEKSRLYSELAQKVASLETANEELEKNRDLLIRVERLSALGEMAAQIAHEMKNPLASIGGVARFIQKHTQEEKFKNHLETIVKETHRLEQILLQIFNFIQSPTLVLKKINLNHLLRSCLQTLQSQLTKSNISLTTDFSPDLPEIELDEDQIKEAVFNICRNAIDAMPSGGQLSVSTRTTQEEVRVEIGDTGVGMVPEQLDKARLPFFTTKTYGIGLGLTLAEKIVNSHQGRLELMSKLGSGVYVTIILPLHRVTND
ncbi:MAG: response regulator [Syntrophales bacterium LBB04]|nr:response regulator [Syntrophales bacterium LBB04]